MQSITHLLEMVPELRERSIWMLTLFSDLFWMTKVTLDCCTSLYTSTLPAPFTLVGAGSACIAHLESMLVRRISRVTSSSVTW